jgi:hypothetical protein
MTSCIKSFSYDIKKASTVAQAEEQSKEKGFRSFSDYLMSLVEKDLSEKKEIAPLGAISNCSNTAVDSVNNNITLDIYTYFPKLVEHITKLEDPDKLRILVKNGQILKSVAINKIQKIKKNESLIIS